MADALEALEEEITTLAAHIHAATCRLLTLLAEFDRRRGWELGGHRSCAHWLSFRTGIDMGAAREKVRAARALGGLPRTRAAMARGELSFSKVRALTRVATPDNEGDLVELARGCTAAQLERMVRAFSRGTRGQEAELDRLRHEARRFSVFPDHDGMYGVRGRVPAETGALLMRAVEAASDALFREETAEGGEGRACRPGVDSQTRAAQRRADALGLLAERALAAGFRDGAVSGTRAARYQVVLHVEAETLRAEGASEGGGGVPGRSNRVDTPPVGRSELEDGTPVGRPGPQDETPLGRSETGSAPPVGRSELEDGTRVSAETSRRISCDAGLVRVLHGPRGAERARAMIGRGPGDPGAMGHPPGNAILDVGRRTRTIPPALRRALEVRDRGCRFPGCGLRFTDAHHLKHWADGGETSLGNTLLLCAHHHRLVHEGGWQVRWWGVGRPVFFDPRGGTHFDGRWRWPRDDDGAGPERREEVRDALWRSERREEVCDALWRSERREEVGDAIQPREGDGADGAMSRPPEGEDLVAALVEENRRQGVRADGWTAGSRWKREADVPDDLYFRSLEAILSG